MMTPVNGVPGAAFVQFADSRNVFRLDALTGQLSLLLTPQQVGFLAGDSAHVSGGRISDGTYAYLWQGDPSANSVGSLLFYDVGGDGTIDSWISIPPGELEQHFHPDDWIAFYSH